MNWRFSERFPKVRDLFLGRWSAESGKWNGGFQVESCNVDFKAMVSERLYFAVEDRVSLI
jgi:hypothetical protein